MIGWPLHRAALHNINGLRKQLAAMELHSCTVGDICTPWLDAMEQAVRDHRDILRRHGKETS